MRLTFALLLLTVPTALAACAGGAEVSRSGAPTTQQTADAGLNRDGVAARSEGGAAATQDASLSAAEASQGAPAASARKIIRNASLTVEVEAPADGLRGIASVAERRGGFVVTSESRRQGGDGGRDYEVVTVEVRVPSEQFDAAVGEIHGLGTVVEEKVTGQDVTEEYIDLEARLRTQRALEAQLLELLKRAASVADTLTVQRELTAVRTEVERVEGRRRFLESQSSLSTIKVTLRPSGLMAGAGTRGFFHGLRRALSNGLDVASTITLGLVQVFVALLPVILLLVVPAVLLARFVRRRLRRRAPDAAEPQLK